MTAAGKEDSQSPGATPGAGPLDAALQALQEFLAKESAGGLVLMGAAFLGLLLANSPLSRVYAAFLELPFSIRLGSHGLGKPVILWINDGIMAVFFLLVGMELKREILEGHLSSLRKASLPGFAAVGGMAVPAMLYLALNRNDPAAMKGWAIPTATDIAFALGVLSLAGKAIPTALKAFLLSVAIFDDLGAILVIAAFYTSDLWFLPLAVAGVLILALAALNRAGVTRAAAYILVGIPLWVAVLKSGVHATLAGVVLAFFIPLRAAEGEESPLKHLEHTLHPWVAFGVLPIFALANAGVPLAGMSLRDALHPVPLGVFAGLVLGKPVGVVGLSWIATKARLAALPDGIRWRQLLGVGILCGIGFTMSLFISSLAAEQGDAPHANAARLGILAASLVAGLAGVFAVRAAVRRAAGNP
jgi:Na+:H+ antiporter, NhaA family